ncbi:ABC transporter permease subunit [Leucobacter sp. UT-8R-CII-1-4]|uniref:ABC transporter permease n=1 Tax=Leucobacter sp. UT-8R-CII-1-4 TaxID=3040075 RepID=UPI0024A8D320|nr:ABC transporter permease subunit [Leucobacter sp. UT-8R-CII-1-4]MDI6023277.1 ABC transporter permease subunit [Leucobacter sp. UT-8R-CII-1-4]
MKHTKPIAAAVSGQPPAWLRRTILIVICGVFVVPLIAMFEFTLRQQDGGYGVQHWAALFDPENARMYRNLVKGIGNSLLLAAITIAIVWVLFLPTIVLVHLQFPRLARAFEMLTILPIAIPAIVLVVGLAPLYRVIVQIFGGDIWTLALAYGILVLPFAYRAIVSELQGMGAKTLVEAARSLGANWITVLWRVIVPGVRHGLTSATLITAAVVLGEFTLSSLLNRVTLQVALVEVSKSDPYAAVITSLLSLTAVFVLLFVFASIRPKGQRARRAGRSNAKKDVTAATGPAATTNESKEVSANG